MTWYRFGEWILRRRFLVLAVVGALTAFFGYFAAQTQLVTSFGDLLPQNHPFIQIAHKYDQYFGSVNNVTIMIEAREGTIYHAKIIKKIVNMTNNMDLVYGIQHGSVRSIATASYFRPLAGGVILNTPILPNGEIPKTAEDLAELREQRPQKSRRGLRPVRLARRQGRGDRPAASSNRVSTTRASSTRFGKIVVKPERDATVHIYYRRSADSLRLGVSLHAGDFSGSLSPRCSRSGSCSIYISTTGAARCGRLSRASSAPSGVSVSSGCSAYGLDPLVLVIPFLITARAVSHSVQMHDRYYEEFYRLRDKEKAILSSFAELFVPSLSGILADAFGVLVILLVPVLFLQKLAITASFWIAAIIVSELLLNPIVYYYLDPPHIDVIEKREHGFFKRMLDVDRQADAGATGPHRRPSSPPPR